MAPGGATGTYANTYGGWQQVENAAVALSEVANLVTIPGRLCENGLPVPIADATFQKGAQGAGGCRRAALEAAKTKNLDKMVDVERRDLRRLPDLSREIPRSAARKDAVRSRTLI